MAEWLSRRALYDLVWSVPLRTLCTRFGISDVALRKACQRVAVPTPERGYWAKKEAGQKVFVPALPPRPPGMDDEVQVGGVREGGGHPLTNEELFGPVPPAPQFEESLEAVRQRIAKIIGKITVPREVRVWDPAIERLLKDDAARREKMLTSSYTASWERPQFEDAAALRRLRILNSLSIAARKVQGRASPDRDVQKSTFIFHQQFI